MAIVMQMSWPEVTKEQYEKVRKEANWEGDVPRGAKLHVAYFAKDGFHVLDLWNSAQDFNAFVETRLMAAVQKAGIKTEPKVEISEAHAIFAPNP
jgi:heme-degrading monooxygenase HmoA